MKKFLSMLLCLLYALSMICAQAAINLPANLTVIGEEAFAGDSSISGLVEVSGNVYRVQAGAFSDTNLTGLELSSSVTYIEDDIVAGSPAIYVAVVNPDAVLSEGALNGASVILSNEGDAAHQWAESNEVEWYDLYDVVRHGDFYYHERGDGTAKLLFAKDSTSVSDSVTIPVLVSDSIVTEISEYAFTCCYGLESVSYPDTIAELPDGDNWPELDFDVYATSTDPVLPPDDDMIELDMPVKHIYLPVGFSDEVVWPEDAPKGYALYYSSDDSIVSVNQYGGYTCHKLGDAAITLVIRTEDKIYTGVTQVHVVEHEDIEIVLTTDSTENMVVGQTVPVSINVQTNTAYSGYLRSAATFTSSNEDVFTIKNYSVNGDFFVTAVGAGTANLIVEIEYGDFYQKAEFPVTVRESELGLNFVKLYSYSGLKEQLVLLPKLPEGASIEWFSEDEDLVTVNQEGLMTLHEVIDGKYDKDYYARTTVYCVVTYADNSTERFDCTVVVYDRDPVILYDFDVEEPLCYYEGYTGSIDELPVYMDWWWNNFHNDLQPEAVLEFTSSDPSVLSFDNEEGTFTAHQKGDVTVSVHGYADIDGGLEADGEFAVEVYEPRFEVSIQEESIEIGILETGAHVDYDIQWEDIAITSYQFTSSNPDVVKVSANGYLTPVGVGEAEITLRVEANNGYAEERSVMVFIYEDGFAMDTEAITLNVGETHSLISRPQLPDGIYVTDEDYWTDNEEIAYFENAVVYGLSAGTTFAWHGMNLSDDRHIAAYTRVTVVDPESPVVLSDNLLYLAAGESYQIKAEFAKTPESVVWSSNNENDVIVDEYGNVTCLGAWDHVEHATVYCTATIDGVEHTACCAVVCEPMSVVIDCFPSQVDMATGDTHQFDCIVSTADPEQEVTLGWTTEDSSIASIDENGLMTAHSTGVTTYTCTAYDADTNKLLHSVSGRVYVNIAPDDPTAIYFERPGYLIAMDGEYYTEESTHVEIEADYEWDRGLLRYSSDNEKIVRIDSDGNLEAVSPGVANITVTMAGFPKLSHTVPVIVAEYVELYVSNEKPAVGEDFIFDLRGLPFEEDDKYYSFRVTTRSDLVRFTDLYYEDENDENGDMMFEAIHDEHHDLYGELRVCGEYYDEFGIWLQPYYPDYRLSDTVVWLNEGEEYEIWPEFGYDGEADHGWSFDGEGVIEAYEKDGRFYITAISKGDCTIEFNGIDYDENGNAFTITASCEIHVRSNLSWNLVSIDVPTYLTVGYNYEQAAHISSRSSIYPEVEWTSSNPEVLAINEDYECFMALQPGTVELTCTAIKDDREVTLTKTVYVIDVPLRMDKQYVEFRPGNTKQLSAIAGKGNEIASVEWFSSNPSVVSVDDEGNITAVGNAGLANIYATATFTDGTTATAKCQAYVLRDDEIWVDFYHLDHSVELSVGGTTVPETATIEAGFSTNGDPSEFSIDWICGANEDEEGNEIVVAEIISTKVIPNDDPEDLNDDQYIAVAEIKAVSEGQINVECFISNDYGFEASRQTEVYVYDPYFDMIANETDYTILTGTSVAPDYQVEQRDGYGPIFYEYKSADESIARVNVWNDIQGIAPGKTTVTYYAYTYDGTLLDSQEFNITVEGISLNIYEATLNAGESVQLLPTVETSSTIDYLDWGTSNPNVAVVSDSGQVIAVGSGKATVHCHVKVNDELNFYAYCTITVPEIEGAEEADFHLTESFIETFCEREIQMEYVSKIGEPESVRWSVRHFGEIDEDGLLRLGGCGEDLYTTVTCSATINGETYTDHCTVLVKPEDFYLGNDDFGGYVYANVDDYHYRHLNYEYVGSLDDVKVDLNSSDPDVAEIFFDKEGTIVFHALSKGISTLSCTITTPSETYELTEIMYVEEDWPEMTKFELGVDTLLLFTPEAGGPSERWIPIHTEPEEVPYGISCKSDNTDVVDFDDEGRVYAVSAGTANIIITLDNYPESEPIVLPVIVLDNAGYSITGLENGLRSGEEIQLGIEVESETNWLEYADISFSTEFDGEHFSITEDGLMYGRHPIDEDQPNFSVTFNFAGEEYTDVHFFDLYCDEEYFFAWHNAEETVVQPGQEFWPDDRASFENYGRVVSSENESIIKVHEDGDHWVAVKPGTTTISWQAVLEDGTYYCDANGKPVTLSVEATVMESEAPIFTVVASNTLRVGEWMAVDIELDNHYYNGPKWSFITSDENILVYEGYLEERGCRSVTAVAPGVVTLTAHANYGDAEGTDSMVVYVLDEAPASINSRDVELRPHQSKQLVITPADGMEIAEINWNSSCPDYVSVDENGLITAGAEGHALITAHITFTDDSTYGLTTKVGVAQDDGLWVNFHGCPDNLTLVTKDFGSAGEQKVNAHFNSNMAEDEIRVTWTVNKENDDDPDYVIIENTYAPEYTDNGVHNGFIASADLKAVSEGTVEITVTIESDFTEPEVRTFEVKVVTPYFEIIPNGSDEIEISIGENRGLDYRHEANDYTGHFSHEAYYSSDKSIVQVSYRGEIYGVSEGTATITVEAYNEAGYKMDSHDFTVHVVDRTPVKLNETSLTLMPGKSAVLSPVDAPEHEFSHTYSDDKTIAAIHNNGTVYGIASGVTNVYYCYHIDGEYYDTRCTVTVLSADESFTLNHSSISLIPGVPVDLDYVSEDEPDSVKWSVNCNDLTIDENGVVSTTEHRFDHNDYVTCTATFDGEERTAICLVTHNTDGVWFDDVGAMHGTSTEHEEDWFHIKYYVANGITAEFTVNVEKPEVLDVWVVNDDRCKDGIIAFHGKQSGVTDVEIILTGSNGSVCKRTTTVYVDTDFPAIESIKIHEDPLIINAGDSRWTVWNTVPENIPNDIVFSCNDDRNIISDEHIVAFVYDTGWIEGHNPGRVTVHAQENRENAELQADFDIVVLGDPTITGLENNTMQAGAQAQLRLSYCNDEGEYVSQDELNVTYSSDWEHHHFQITEDGLLSAFEPGDYNIKIEVKDDSGYRIEYYYNFTVEWPEEHFYAKYSEFAMYEGQTNHVELIEDLGLGYLSVEFETEGILEYIPEQEALRAITPGETDVYIYGHYWDNDTVETCANVLHVTVLEREKLDFEITTTPVIRVREIQEVLIYCDCQSTYCPDFYVCESSDESILRVYGQHIVGVATGSATLTVTLGEGENATVREMTVYVIAPDEEAFLHLMGPEDQMLGTNEVYGPANSMDVTADFNTTMPENKFTVSWTSDNEDVVVVENFSYSLSEHHNLANGHFSYVSTATLSAIGEGSANITMRIDSETGKSDEHTFRVDVITPSFEIYTEEPEMTIRMHDHQDLNFEIKHDDSVHQFSYYTLTSSNPDVVKVDANHSVYGRNAGTATVTVNAYTGTGKLMASQDFTVTVTAPAIDLNETELVLRVGEIAELHHTGIPEGLTYQYNNWYSDSNGIASVNGNEDGAVVVASGVGQTNVFFTYEIDGEYNYTICRVTVVSEDDSFRLSEEYIALSPGATIQLSYISEETPDSVEWYVGENSMITVDQEGNVTADCDRYNTDDMVYCTATFGDEVRTAACHVGPANSGVHLEGIGSLHQLSVDEHYHLGTRYRVIGDIEAELEYSIDDPSIADIYMDEDGRIIIYGKQPGVTDVHVAICGSDGSRYEQFVKIYVDTYLPLIEEIIIQENPLVLYVDEDRWIPRETVPGGEPGGIEFFCLEENDIISIHDYDWIYGLNPGRVTVRAQACSNPDYYVDFDVVVLGEPIITGLENDTLLSGHQAQLDYSFGDVDTTGLNFTFVSHDHHGMLGFYSDSNTLEGRSTGERTIYLEIDGYDRRFEYKFNVEYPGDYLYANYSNFVMYEGQVSGLEYSVGVVDYITCEFSEDGIVDYVVDTNNLVALTPGETTVTLTGHSWNEEEGTEKTVECVNQMHITVLPTEPLDFEVTSPLVIRVGESHDVSTECECQATFCPNFFVCESSNEDVLSVDGHRITGIAAGTATLTVTLGEGENATVREVTISVIE